MTKYSGTALMLVTTAALTGPLVTAAAANPLCASAHQRQIVESALADAPKQSMLQVARASDMTEAAVVHALPPATRVPVAMSEFDELWQELTEWEDALVIVRSSDSVFELPGPLPTGSPDGDYFDFDEPDGHYSGRLKLDRLAAIYLLSTDSDISETHRAAFYDHDGRLVFSVHVPRNEIGALQSQPHNRFLRFKDTYQEIARKQLLTDYSCMWASRTNLEQSQVEEHMQ